MTSLPKSLGSKLIICIVIIQCVGALRDLQDPERSCLISSFSGMSWMAAFIFSRIVMTALCHFRLQCRRSTNQSVNRTGFIIVTRYEAISAGRINTFIMVGNIYEKDRNMVNCESYGKSSLSHIVKVSHYTVSSHEIKALIGMLFTKSYPRACWFVCQWEDF